MHFFGGIFTIPWYQTCYALDGVVVDCVNHTISVSLHSAAGGDVFSQAAPSLLFPTCSLSVHDNKIQQK